MIICPGIYADIPNAVYHASPGVSSSGISALIAPNCPKNYWYKYLSGECPYETNDSFLLGTVVHTLALEPETFDSRFLVANVPSKRLKSYESLMAQLLKDAKGREIVCPKIVEEASKMADALTSHKLFKTLGKGNVEHSLAWIDEESGALLRSRPDYYNENIILDIKTSRALDPASFSSSVFRYGYHRQAAMACDGLTKLTGKQYDTVILFVVSKEPPYLVRSYVIGTESLEIGRQQYKAGAKLYQRCLTENNWPGYPEIVEDIELPRWAFYEIEENRDAEID
jgi:hypothetical protein